MARGLTPKDLEHIDELAAFYVKSEQNAKLLDVMSALIAVSNVSGAGAVMAKRVKELQRQAKRDAAK